MATRLFLFLLLVSTGLSCQTDIHSVSSTPDLCLQPLETGLCKAYMPSFGYDSEKKLCVRFIYGGCGGNDNRFLTKKECEQKCSSDRTE